MNLKTMVTFKLFARNVDNHKRYDICGIDDIRSFIQQHINLFDMPCYMEVSRRVHIVNLDEPKKGSGFEIFDKTYFNGFRQLTSFDLSGDSLNFVFPVMYPKDIREYVAKRPWGMMTCAGLDECPNDVPVVFRDCIDRTSNNIRLYTSWVPLDKETIIGIDKNMNQVWPVATEELPIALIKFLQENTVTIR